MVVITNGIRRQNTRNFSDQIDELKQKNVFQIVSSAKPNRSDLRVWEQRLRGMSSKLRDGISRCCIHRVPKSQAFYREF